MKTWFTADPHFGHKNIIEYCKRPFSSVEEMNKGLLHGINSTVGAGDRLVILGDVCMGKLEESMSFLQRIEAEEIILVPGNHDRWSLAYKHRGTPEEQVEKRLAFAQKFVMDTRFKVLSDEEPSYWELSHFLPYAPDAFVSHYPYEGDHGDVDRYAWLRAADDGLPIIHGHVHTEWRTRGRQFNVGVDVNGYRPVSEETLMDWIKELKR